MAKKEHELDRAVAQLLGEIQQLAPKFAENLFPQGPAGHKVLPREPLLAMVRDNWQDKSFRKTMLDRLSPPGPNGMPAVEEGIDTFIKLYTDAVLKSDVVWQDTPATEAGAVRLMPDNNPVPQPLDGGGEPTGASIPAPTPPAAGAAGATTAAPAMPPGAPPPPPYPGAG